VIPSFRKLRSPQGNWYHQLVISNGPRSKIYSFPIICILTNRKKKKKKEEEEEEEEEKEQKKRTKKKKNKRVWAQYCFHRNQ